MRRRQVLPDDCFEHRRLCAPIRIRRHACRAGCPPHDRDGKAGRSYGAKTTPNMYVIDPQGKLVYAGVIDDRRPQRKGDVRFQFGAHITIPSPDQPWATSC